MRRVFDERRVLDMPELRWRPDLQHFELLGESLYSLEHDVASGVVFSHDELVSFIQKHWEVSDWDKIYSFFLDTRVRLAALDKTQQQKCRIGIAPYWPGEPEITNHIIGYVELLPHRSSEVGLAKRGVRRLSNFIQRFEYPVVCETQIVADLKDDSKLSANITIHLPYEDEVVWAVNGYIGPDDDAESQRSIERELETGIHKAVFNNGVNEGGSTVSFDPSSSTVTILPPEITHISPAQVSEVEKIRRHLRSNVATYERYVELALIPHLENSFDDEAISVALPKRYGGDERDRHIGYLYRDYKQGELGILLGELSKYSGGEIRCFGEIKNRVEDIEIYPLLPPSLDLQEDIEDFLEDSEISSP